ncbi:MAG TPA: gephyrin-like molybdotransferase Glp [Tepidisphaeraceae bacterium]|jgi:molybdopterin molybdotransferase
MSEPDVSDLMTVAQAIAVIDAAPVTPRIGRVKLEDAQGLRLAQDLRADRDYPPFHKSLMDGYAVRCEDVRTTPVELEVVGEVAAGQRHPRILSPGQTVAIMTGAPIPEGADGVVPVEDTIKDGPANVRILRADAPERFSTRQGADCAAGSVVLAKGIKLEAAQLAVAASVGASEVEAFQRPRVAVLSTGDELVPIDTTPGPAQIRNSNNVMMCALLRRLGCDVIDLGTARDEPGAIRQAIERGFNSDALFVSGGMSMGQYDYVPKILRELGTQLRITKLRIKPGKPFIFGVREGRFVFGLPGNPVSSFVCAVRLCSRLIGRLGGTGPLERWTEAKLESALPANGPREFYQPAILASGTVQPLKWKGSADIYTLANANGLIMRTENAPALPAGATVGVLEIPS